MPVNGTITLAMTEAQTKHPKGKGVEEAVASAYKNVEKLKAKYPYKPEAHNMSYGSKGTAYGD